MTNTKIVSLDAIADRSRVLQEQGKKIVLCHGTFDLMHIGHIRSLQRAKREGDILLVTVTADEYVNKGPGRPVFSHELRAENLAALQCVDYVAINYAVTAVDALHKIRPTIYVKGSEYRSRANDVTGNITREQDAVEAYGGRIFYTDEITFSSSGLLNEHFGVFPPDTKRFLENFRERFQDLDVHRMIDSLADLNVLVVGDAIVDQYHYVSPLGQTGKGNVLAVKYTEEEQFAGGSAAVANHIAMLVRSVTLATAVGDMDNHETFIREKLKKNVQPVFSRFKNAPTVTKRRFVDSDLAKLFEVYFFDEEPKLEDDGAMIYGWLDNNIDKYDAVVVADFGNGFVTDSMIEMVSRKSRYLAVNTQINSGNRGYHVINRYPRADFVSLNEPELRLAAHNRRDTLENVVETVCARVGAKQLAVTRGTKGAVLFSATTKMFYTVPALSSRVIDRIGAGDAFLALSALCLAKGISGEIAVFVGSVAAAMDVQIVCNREPLDPVAIKKYVSTLLK